VAKPYVPYDGPLVTHAEAAAKGLKRYFPGSRCRRAGHLSERFTSSGNCIACASITVVAYHKANSEKHNAIQRRYNKAHPERLRAYWVANKDKLQAQRRARRRADPDKSRAEVRKWFAANPGVVQRWRKANPEAYRAQVQTRHARVANAEGRHTADELKALFQRQRGRCAYCSKSIRNGYHVDHIIPLARGGSNWISNIALACAKCNLTKSATDPIEFARRNGKLL
jgi:5-methylcytosine-specific restriction endonuclease McrA